MPSFGRTSKERLKDADPRLVEVLEWGIEVVDFTILETHRSKERQNRMFREKKSKLRWPKSKHNTYPSLAVDVAPWPIDWDDIRRFDRLASFLQGIAYMLDYELRWGGDWDRDWDLQDNRFNDLPHLELVT